MFHLQIILNVWCWWFCGRTSKDQANQVASLTPVLVVFQNRPLMYVSFGTLCLSYPLPTVAPGKQLKLSRDMLHKSFFCYREKFIHFLTIEYNLLNKHGDLVFQSYSFYHVPPGIYLMLPNVNVGRFCATHRKSEYSGSVF